MTNIHTELASLSGENPAGYIESGFFSRLTVDRLLERINLMKGIAFKAGRGEVVAILNSATWPSPKAYVDSPISKPNEPASKQSIDVVMSSGLKFNVDLALSTDATKIISTIIVNTVSARTHVRAENNLLIIEGATYESTQIITRKADASKIIADAGIDPLEVSRVEGWVGYGVVTESVEKILAARSEVSLEQLFPGFVFGSAINLAVLDSGKAVGIVPTQPVIVRPGAHCTCNDGPDLGVSESPTSEELKPKPTPQKGDKIGNVGIGGPIADNKDPLRDLGRRPVGKSGIAGVYLPESFASGMLVDVMPSITVVAKDEGTIGFRAEATVGFKNPKFSIDTSGGGFLFDIDLDISISAYCDLDILCTRLPIGWAVVLPASGSQPHIQMGFYPRIDSSLGITLTSILKKVDMGSYVALIVGVGTALEIFGVTAWIGFLVDVVLSAIVSHELPVKLKQAVQKYLGNHEWKLFDGMSLLKSDTRRWFPAAPFDVGPSSILTSVEIAG